MKPICNPPVNERAEQESPVNGAGGTTFCSTQPRSRGFFTSARSFTGGLIFLAFALLVCGGCHHQSTAPVFDVPSLMGKNIDDLTKAVPGATVADAPATSNTPTQQRNFTKNGQTLHVIYKPASRKVVEFDLDVDPQTGAIKDDDKESFLSVGNLKATDARYTVELTEDPNKVFYFTGAKITPNPLAHHVIFSVTGTEAMTDITYAARTNGADVKTENMQNLPPWQTEMDITVAATDDTDLTLQAKPYSGPAFSPSRIPVPADYKVVLQITVDGRVVSTATSTGFTANCVAQL